MLGLSLLVPIASLLTIYALDSWEYSRRVALVVWVRNALRSGGWCTAKACASALRT